MQVNEKIVASISMEEWMQTIKTMVAKETNPKELRDICMNGAIILNTKIELAVSNLLKG